MLGKNEAVSASAASDSAPILQIRLEDGTGHEFKTIKIRIPSELSLRVAKMYLLEMMVKLVKVSLGDVLKAMGFK